MFIRLRTLRKKDERNLFRYWASRIHICCQVGSDNKRDITFFSLFFPFHPSPISCSTFPSFRDVNEAVSTRGKGWGRNFWPRGRGQQWQGRGQGRGQAKNITQKACTRLKLLLGYTIQMSFVTLNIKSSRTLSHNFARFGSMISPLCENILSTAAELAGTQRTR